VVGFVDRSPSRSFSAIDDIDGVSGEADGRSDDTLSCTKPGACVFDR